MQTDYGGVVMPEMCEEHFYMKQSVNDMKKDYKSLHKDMTHLKIILFIILADAIGIVPFLSGVLL